MCIGRGYFHVILLICIQIQAKDLVGLPIIVIFLNFKIINEL